MFSSKIKLSGDLDSELMPNLNTLKGSLVAEVFNARVNPEKNNILSTLNTKTSFVNLDQLNLDNLKTSLNFEEGKVNVNPFNLKITDDISAEVSGSHGFDSGMSYNLNMEVPVKYLGTSATDLLTKLSATDQENTKVPLPVVLGGTLKQPSVNVNMKTALATLTSQVIAGQKAQLQEQVKDKVSDEVSNQINKQVGGKVGEVLNSVLGGDKNTNNEETDTQKQTEDPIKNAAGNVLNNLFNKKK